MPINNDAPLRIAICGGGIGGLCLALVLQKFAQNKDLTVNLYEADTSFNEPGAGISIWHRSRFILRQLGLENAFKDKTASPPFYVRKSDIPEGFTFTKLMAPGNPGTTTLHRQEMMNLLVDGLAAGASTRSSDFLTNHFSKRLVKYEEDSSGVTLFFEDGTSAHADVLIGADGISSPTRKTMYTKLAEASPSRADEFLSCTRAIWSGYNAYRFLVDTSKIKAIDPNHLSISNAGIWCGNGEHGVTYPISKDHVNVAIIYNTPDGFGKPLVGSVKGPTTKPYVLQQISRFENDLLLLAKNGGDMSHWSICQVRPLPHFVSGRVALLGDSAHAMVPFLGAGAGQAIEDAYILGRLLTESSVNSRNVTSVLKVYDEIRRPIAREVAERSLRMGLLNEFVPEAMPPDADFEKIKAGDLEHLGKLDKAMQEQWKFHYSKMPDEDWEKAKAMLSGVLLR